RRLFFAVLLAVGAAVAAMVVGFNLLLAHNLGNDADRLLPARAGGELALLSVQHGRVVVSDAPDDAHPQPDRWIFVQGRMLESPRASRLVNETARRLAARAPGFLDVPGTDTRLYAAPVFRGGRRL